VFLRGYSAGTQNTYYNSLAHGSAFIGRTLRIRLLTAVAGTKL
jgi:hypothetical protein